MRFWTTNSGNNFQQSFRSVIASRSYSSGAPASLSGRFGFDGKEKDNETLEGAYDFGARIYDGRLGRWLAVDNVKKSELSVYVGFVNNPIFGYDPNGNDDFFGTDGKYIGSIDNGTDNVYVVKHKDVKGKNKIVTSSTNKIALTDYMNSQNAKEKKVLKILMRIAYHYYDGDAKFIGGARVDLSGVLAYYDANDDAIRLCYSKNSEGKYTFSKLLNTTSNIRTALDHEENHRKILTEEQIFENTWVNPNNSETYERGELEPFSHTLSYLAEFKSTHFRKTTAEYKNEAIDGFIFHLNSAFDNVKSGTYPYNITKEMFEKRVTDANKQLFENRKKGSGYYQMQFNSETQKYEKLFVIEITTKKKKK